MIKFFILFSLLLGAMDASEDKTVLIAILARNKAHVLPRFLKNIDSLEYDKKKISVYINTNNNQDETERVLRAWQDKNQVNYRSIVFESHHVESLNDTNPHEWNENRFHALGKIRNQSLAITKKENCDYYFVVDCDNFIEPCTLKELVTQDKPIIAPLLTAFPKPGDMYSNFFCAVSESGYFRDHPDYGQILLKKKKGIFEVPLVHCTYLIKKEYIDKLTYVDGSDDYEFVIFAKSARNNDVSQYIDNEKYFGQLLHLDDNVTLEEEAEFMASLEAPKTQSVTQEVFSKIYRNAEWGKNAKGEGFSGSGSLLENAKPYMTYLEDFLTAHQIQSVVDLGCGDWEFSKCLNWKNIYYLGLDVVQKVIQKNVEQFSKQNIVFSCIEGASAQLPAADLLICKDVLQHLPHRDIENLSHQFSKFKYCLITNDVSFDTLSSNNEDVQEIGGYRTLDLTKAPFNFKAKKVLTYRAGNHVKQVILLENEICK
jgi:hypothetical protein